VRAANDRLRNVVLGDHCLDDGTVKYSNYMC